MICKRCGTINDRDRSFCSKCGEFLVEVEPAGEVTHSTDGYGEFDLFLNEKRWKKWQYLAAGASMSILGIPILIFVILLFPWIPFLWPIVLMFCVIMPAVATLLIFLGFFRAAGIFYIISGIADLPSIAIGLLGFWAAVHCFRRKEILRILGSRDEDLKRSNGWTVRPSPAKRITAVVIMTLMFIVPLAVAGANTAGTNIYIKEVLVPTSTHMGFVIIIDIHLSNLGFTKGDGDEIAIKINGDAPVSFDWTGGDVGFGKDVKMNYMYDGIEITTMEVWVDGELSHEKSLYIKYVSEWYQYPY